MNNHSPGSMVPPKRVARSNTNIEKAYDIILKQVIEPLVGTITTSNIQLNNAGKLLFGRDWLGVVSADSIPEHISPGKFLIANLDKRIFSGSHWIGIVQDKNDTLLYDSFGRDPNDILPHLKSNKFISTDGVEADDIDAEQHVSEKNCGARTLAALMIYKIFGREGFMKL